MNDLFDPVPPLDGVRQPDAALAHYAERAYLEYALSVVKGRALPDVCDGQKPVQRRILYAMQRMGLAFTTAAGPQGRSRARAWWATCSAASTRTATPPPTTRWCAWRRTSRQRYPLVDGQGNFGSRDGDGAAAMRYTEARLAPIARLLLDEIDEGTVDFVPNYDGSTEEPRQLPARLPFVLLNGASGIAVGLATEVPSHNLREVAAAAVALIRDDKLSDDELFALLPGPDFPGGGQIISSAADIRAAYAGGRGSLKVRARWKIEDLARGQWQLVVTELPPGTSAQKVLEEIEELTNPKVKAGKKALSPNRCSSRPRCWRCWTRCATSRARTPRCGWCSSPRAAAVEQQELITTLLAHTSLETSRADQPDDGRGRRPADAEEPAPDAGRMDRLPPGHGAAAHPPPAGEGARPHPRARRPAARAAEHRRGDPHHPQSRRAQAGADRGLQRSATGRPRTSSRSGCASWRGWRRSRSSRSWPRACATEQKKLDDILGSPAALKRTVIREIEADAKQYGDDRRTLIQAEQAARWPRSASSTSR